MAHSHYVMDLYFRDGDTDRYRREVVRIEAPDDAAAISEGHRADQWRKSSYFDIRAIRTSSRSGDKLIYSSRPAEPAGEGDAAQSAAATP